ncbi:hypothetical protein B9G69_013840 [Bdellovibrio sp. SKB1291214]|uniref:hypothetical protein n=1 Tax=Bdellovibrio sp. SKB1291214 TaxID=1732569 RepID=UPI000B516B15|nr:hypothetical protein [Bdellovibrio sp. SKB1291214]UYL08128.1 hypothetical protein B9G69_013840 [Bdellovibrio sp. SKB1291214]
MISKTSLVSQLLMVTALSVGHNALAAERFSVKDWGNSLEASLADKSGKKTLELLDFKNLEGKVAISKDDNNAKNKIKKARELFAQGKYSQALALYNEVPRGSDYWFQVVEEKGWAQFRMNSPEKALAQSKTLISPQFAEVVNAEAYFLQSLAELKICDYKSVFKTTQAFKEKQRDRIASVQALSKEGFNEAFLNVLKKADKFPLTAADMGDSMLKLPVLFYKDLELQKQMLRFKASQKGMEVLAANNTQRTLQTQLDQINKESFVNMKVRMQQLAADETVENKRIIGKLNLVEVEAIQRVHTDQQLADSAYSEGKFQETNSDQLVFKDDGRPWIDELDKYDVVTKSCAQNVRRKM